MKTLSRVLYYAPQKKNFRSDTIRDLFGLLNPEAIKDLRPGSEVWVDYRPNSYTYGYQRAEVLEVKARADLSKGVLITWLADDGSEGHVTVVEDHYQEELYRPSDERWLQDLINRDPRALVIEEP